MAVCPNCGQENPDGATQCSACGYPLGAPAPQSNISDLPPPPAGASPPQGYPPPPGFQLPPGHPEYQPLPGYSPPQSGYPPPQTGIPYGVMVPFPEQLTPQQKTGQFFAGLGIGLIPLVLGLIVLSGALNNANLVQIGGFLVYLALGLFIAAFVLAIVFMTQPARRFLGYGMLTSVLASPVIFFISCVAVISGALRPR